MKPCRNVGVCWLNQSLYHVLNTTALSFGPRLLFISVCTIAPCGRRLLGPVQLQQLIVTILMRVLDGKAELLICLAVDKRILKISVSNIRRFCCLWFWFWLISPKIRKNSDYLFARSTLPTYIQCDQIARLFFNIWPFTSMKIWPKVYKICQSRFNILPNSK